MIVNGDPRPAPGAELDPDELAQLATEVLGDTAFPAMILRAPSATIAAASPHAIELLSPDGGRVLGRSLDEFVLEQPSGIAELFALGHLNGIEMSHTLRRHAGPDQLIRLWFRRFDGQPTSRFVLAVLVPDDDIESASTPAEWSDAPAVVGTVDENLQFERVSSDADALFGRPVPELIGRSLLTVLEAEDVPQFLKGVSEAFAGRRGVTLDVDVRFRAQGEAAGGRHTCEVLVVPLQPSPSFAFVFLPVPEDVPRSQVSSDLPGMLFRLGRGAQLARSAGDALTRLPASMPGTEKLTARELQIIAPLLDGDRPPAIASTLFLSQSTVRNHLSSIYAKLGVTSQQELVNAFRAPSRTPSNEDD